MTRSMRRATRIAIAGAIALALGIPLAALAASRGAESSAATPSFARDVAPVIQQKCAGCHRIGGIAPMPFETARQISSRSALIAATAQAGLMPPWPPGPRSPSYAGEQERRLSDRERATLLAWAKAGGRVDGPAREPLPEKPVQVAPGESLLTLRMHSAYKPRAAKGVTDDYRCFLLDPKRAGDSFVTSARIEPGADKVVHHVILFRVGKAQVQDARRLDSGSAGLGWNCFGGTGLPAGAGSGAIQDSLNDANWVAAWAPGWGGNRLPDGTGVPLPAGSQIVMQVHYNLLNGRAPDRSRAVLTVAPAAAKLTPLQTMLLPAPVELGCAKGERGRLCNRNEALFDLTRKYGSQAAFVPAGLLILCRGSAANPRAGAVSTCDRALTQPTTIHVVAGHMHLLGASIRIELNPGTPRARVLLDIPRWDFHWQNAYTLARSVQAGPGDVVRVTCRHDVHKRMHGGHGVPKTPRYILWGEGTTDEMCLGILQVTRP
jgi:Copper type II ascorbate-dependent monooxygenase, N-terminal domain/Copper type II ascorbate-dependent monooxygenase, C-terminal domain